MIDPSLTKEICGLKAAIFLAVFIHLDRQKWTAAILAVCWTASMLYYN